MAANVTLSGNSLLVCLQVYAFDPTKTRGSSANRQEHKATLWTLTPRATLAMVSTKKYQVVAVEMVMRASRDNPPDQPKFPLTKSEPSSTHATAVHNLSFVLKYVRAGKKGGRVQWRKEVKEVKYEIGYINLQPGLAEHLETYQPFLAFSSFDGIGGRGSSHSLTFSKAAPSEEASDRVIKQVMSIDLNREDLCIQVRFANTHVVEAAYFFDRDGAQRVLLLRMSRILRRSLELNQLESLYGMIESLDISEIPSIALPEFVAAVRPTNQKEDPMDVPAVYAFEIPPELQKRAKDRAMASPAEGKYQDTPTVGWTSLRGSGALFPTVTEWAFADGGDARKKVAHIDVLLKGSTLILAWVDPTRETITMLSNVHMQQDVPFETYQALKASQADDIMQLPHFGFDRVSTGFCQPLLLQNFFESVQQEAERQVQKQVALRLESEVTGLIEQANDIEARKVELDQRKEALELERASLPAQRARDEIVALKAEIEGIRQAHALERERARKRIEHLECEIANQETKSAKRAGEANRKVQLAKAAKKKAEDALENVKRELTVYKIRTSDAERKLAQAEEKHAQELAAAKKDCVLASRADALTGELAQANERVEQQKQSLAQFQDNLSKAQATCAKQASAAKALQDSLERAQQEHEQTQGQAMAKLRKAQATCTDQATMIKTLQDSIKRTEREHKQTQDQATAELRKAQATCTEQAATIETLQASLQQQQQQQQQPQPSPSPSPTPEEEEEEAKDATAPRTSKVLPLEGVGESGEKSPALSGAVTPTLSPRQAVQQLTFLPQHLFVSLVNFMGLRQQDDVVQNWASQVGASAREFAANLHRFPDRMWHAIMPGDGMCSMYGRAFSGLPCEPCDPPDNVLITSTPDGQQATVLLNATLAHWAAVWMTHHRQRKNGLCLMCVDCLDRIARFFHRVKAHLENVRNTQVCLVSNSSDELVSELGVGACACTCQPCVERRVFKMLLRLGLFSPGSRHVRVTVQFGDGRDGVLVFQLFEGRWQKVRGVPACT